MTLFNYGGCDKCNCMKNDVRVVLSNLFLPNICEQISNYNVYCRGCKNARDKETVIIEYGMSYEMSKIEMQLEYMKRKRPRRFVADSPMSLKISEMNKLIDFYEEDKRTNKVMKKFFKDYYFRITVDMMADISNRKQLNKETKYFQICGEGYFSYNRVLYEERPIIINLLYMYLIDMIGNDDHLVDMKEVKKYLSDNVWKHDDN